jgi:hypothetical protein
MLFIGGYGIVIIIITINTIIPMFGQVDSWAPLFGWTSLTSAHVCYASLLSGNRNLFVNVGE